MKILLLLLCLFDPSYGSTFSMFMPVVMNNLLDFVPYDCKILCVACQPETAESLHKLHKLSVVLERFPGESSKWFQFVDSLNCLISINDNMSRMDGNTLNGLYHVLKRIPIRFAVFHNPYKEDFKKPKDIPLVQTIEAKPGLLQMEFIVNDKFRIFNFWRKERGLLQANPSDNPLRTWKPRLLLLEKTLDVSYAGSPPYIVYAEPLKGADVDILNVFARKFKFNLTFTSQRGWGNYDKDRGIWLGTVGGVYNGTSDIGIGHLALLHERYEAVDYLTRLYTNENGVYARKPSQTKPYENLLKPFSLTLWILTLFSFILVTIFFLVSSKITEERKSQNNSILWVSGIAAYAVLFGETFHCNLLLRSLSVKIGYLTWLTCTTFLVMAYFSDFRAILMAINYDKAIDDLDDLLESGRTLYLMPGTSMEVAFRTSPIKKYQEVYEKLHLDRNGLITHIENGWLPSEIELALYEGRGAMIGTEVAINESDIQ